MMQVFKDRNPTGELKYSADYIGTVVIFIRWISLLEIKSSLQSNDDFRVEVYYALSSHLDDNIKYSICVKGRILNKNITIVKQTKYIFYKVFVEDNFRYIFTYLQKKNITIKEMKFTDTVINLTVWLIL
jgi:hypothetical protein